MSVCVLPGIDYELNPRYTTDFPISSRRGTSSISIKIHIPDFRVWDRTDQLHREYACLLISTNYKTWQESFSFTTSLYPPNHTKYFDLTSMHVLSFRLADSPTLINAPSSAASRIIHHPRSIDFESRWNQEVAHLFNRVISWDQRISEWGRKVLYGEQTPRNKV